MLKIQGSTTTKSTRQPAGKNKENLRLQLDCQLFAKTICPDLRETACSIKDG
jgi:hypothetical protein